MTSTTEKDDGSGLDSFIVKAQNDMPRIDSSVKNLIALLVGSSFTTGAIDLKAAMTCAKVLLQVIQRHELYDIEAFCSKYPQNTDTQSGLQRLDEVCQYKTISLLRSAVIAKAQKISKLFGRLYFQWTKVWVDIRDEVEQELIEKHSATVTIDEVHIFLDTYEKSLSDGSEYSELVWATDFNAELAKRQEKRKQAAVERLETLSSAAPVQEDDEDQGSNEGEEAIVS